MARQPPRSEHIQLVRLPCSPHASAAQFRALRLEPARHASDLRAPLRAGGSTARASKGQPAGTFSEVSHPRTPNETEKAILSRVFEMTGAPDLDALREQVEAGIATRPCD